MSLLEMFAHLDRQERPYKVITSSHRSRQRRLPIRIHIIFKPKVVNHVRRVERQISKTILDLHIPTRIVKLPGQRMRTVRATAGAVANSTLAKLEVAFFP